MTRVFLSITDPPARLINNSKEGTGKFFERLQESESIQDENDILNSQNSFLRSQNQILLEKIRKLESQSRIRQDRSYEHYDFLSANVIGKSLNRENKTIRIDLGLSDGLEVYQPVVGLKGLIGVIETIGARSSLVRLVTDRQFAVAALIGESRLNGYIQGISKDDQVEFHYDNFYVRPEPEQKVITSGMAGVEDSILPKGLLIGYIETTEINTRSIP